MAPRARNAMQWTTTAMGKIISSHTINEALELVMTQPEKGIARIIQASQQRVETSVVGNLPNVLNSPSTRGIQDHQRGRSRLHTNRNIESSKSCHFKEL
jgi:hypothetical protein